VPPADPATFPVTGIAYVADQSEENIPSREEAANLAKQFIAAQPR